MSTPYLSVADVERALSQRKLAQLSNDDPKAVTPDEVVVQEAIDASQQLVDGYLRARHELPLEPVPTIIKELTLNLACYRLYARRMETKVPETVIDRRDAALKTLEHIQSGRVSFGNVQTGKVVPEAGAIRIKVPPRQFGEDTLSKWRM